MATKLIAGSPNEDVLDGSMSYDRAVEVLGGPVSYALTHDARVVAFLKTPGEDAKQNRAATALLADHELASLPERGIVGDVVIGTSEDFGLDEE